MAISTPRTLTTPTQSGSGSTLVVTSSDAALQVGDLRLVWFTITSNPISVSAVPSGWTEQINSNHGTTSVRRHCLYTHVHAAGDPSYTWTFSATTNFGHVQAAVGGANAAPHQVSTTANTADTGTSATAPSLTTTVADTVLMVFYGVSTNSSSATASLPSGMTNLGTRAGTGTAGNLVRGAYQLFAATGATGVKTSTIGSAIWSGSSVVLAPAVVVTETGRDALLIAW